MYNLRISVTDIDQYRYFRETDQAVEILMARLRKEEPASEAMLAGIAFHKSLELAPEGNVECLEANGYRFILPLGSDIEVKVPEIRELKLEREIPISKALKVTLVGKVDAYEGKTVYDHKTSSRFDPERLMDTYQWRYYLRGFQADAFVWNVFITELAEPQCYVIKDFHVLRQYRYRDLDSDCSKMLDEFLDFLNVSRLKFPKADCRLADLLRAN